MNGMTEIINLLRIALSVNTTNDAIGDEVDLNQVYYIARKHMILALIASALEKSGIREERFVNAKAKATRKMTLLDHDKDILFRELSKNQIWHMPLKGSVIKDLYPNYGTREMADYDIFFDARRAKDVRRIMTDLGFEVASYGHGLHDEYHKKPLSNFEMHRMLCGPSDKRFYEYYSSIYDRLLTDKNDSYLMHFTPEDCYVYLKAHDYKHYSLRGTGLRYLADMYLYLRKYGSQMDWNYVERECAKLGIAEFEKTGRGLVNNLFSGQTLSNAENKMLQYIWESGAGGSSENRVRNKVRGKGKAAGIRYLLGRIFIPMGKVKESYPLIYKIRPLIIFLPLIRVFEALTKHRGMAKKEVREALKRK